MELYDVDLEKAIHSNRQLSMPMPRNRQRTYFFELLKNGKSFSRSVFLCMPERVIRQQAKHIIIKMKKLKGVFTKTRYKYRKAI